MARVLAPFLLPGSNDPADNYNKCRLPPSQGNFWQTPLFTNAQAMMAYWRVRKWKVDITVSGFVVGSISCDLDIIATDESDLVCGKQSSGNASTIMSTPSVESTTAVDLNVYLTAYEIRILINFENVPESGDSQIEWDTTSSSGSNQITLTIGDKTKNLVGAYNSDAVNVAATGTMKPVQWWSYDGLYNTKTGARL
jgi:hypothetical protein